MTDLTDADLDALERRATAGERVVMQIDGETVAALVREVRAARRAGRADERLPILSVSPCRCMHATAGGVTISSGCIHCGGAGVVVRSEGGVIHLPGGD